MEHVYLGLYEYIHVCMCISKCVWCLQQVDATVVQQVGGALCSLLHNLVLVDNLHCLVVNAQPAVQTDVEDIRCVMAACSAVPMVIDNFAGQTE